MSLLSVPVALGAATPGGLPLADEPGVVITNEGTAAQVLDRALSALGRRKEHA